jgi:hypothetical protein
MGFEPRMVKLKLTMNCIKIIAIIYTMVKTIHRVSQEERSIFWEVTVSVILSKKLCMNT